MRLVLVLFLTGLAACSSSSEEDAAQRARDVAEVRANQTPPPEQLAPEPILYPDIEQNDLFGAGCNFVAEGAGMGAIALAQRDEGYMKRSGKILTFAADKGSTQQPLGSWRKYDGKEYGFVLDLENGSEEQAGIETVNVPARLTVRDGRGQTVFESRGTAQCGS